MGPAEPSVGSGLFVHLGIILHGTGPQGIELTVYRKIKMGKPGKVADHRELIQFGEFWRLPEEVPGEGRFRD
jgi:hypothetical protein